MKIRSIKFNFLMNSVSTVLNFIFPLITFPYVSRVLMPANYGVAEFALSTAQIFAIVALLGVNTYGQRECARVRDSRSHQTKIMQELCLIIVVWTTVVTVAYYSTVLLIPRFEANQEAFLIAGLLIPFSTLGFNWFMTANEQYSFLAVRNLLSKVFIVVCMFVFVREQNDVFAWVFISIASTGLVSLANLIYIKREVVWVSWKQLNWKQHIKPLLVFFFMVASISIYTTLDAVMLGYMTTDEQVAYYNIAVKIKNVFTAIIAALANVIIPRAAYYLEKNNKKEYYKIVNLSVHGAVAYVFFAVFAGILFADQIILVIAGSDYMPSIVCLIAVMPAVAFISFTQITSLEILTPQNYEKALAFTYGIAGLIDICLNLILIPLYASLGAAIATSVAEGFVLAAQLIIIHRKDKISNYTKGLTRMIIPISLAVIVLLLGRIFINTGIIESFVVIAVAGIVLLVSLLIAKEPLMKNFIGLLGRKKK